MAIIRWNPWNLSSLLDEDWELPTVPGLPKVLGQGLNMYETEKDIVAEVALPGISEDKIDVSVDDGVVRISAASGDKVEEKSGRRYFMSSMASTYNYSFRLPESVKEDMEPEATLENGVLKLAFPKAEVKPPKKIKIQSTSTPKKVDLSK